MIEIDKQHICKILSRLISMSIKFVQPFKGDQGNQEYNGDKNIQRIIPRHWK